MKMSTLTAVVNYLKNVPEMQEAYQELTAEVEKQVKKVEENKVMYAAAKEVAMKHLTDELMDVNALLEAGKDEWPEDFTKSKLQYALNNYWSDEVERVKEGRNPYKYKKKA